MVARGEVSAPEGDRFDSVYLVLPLGKPTSGLSNSVTLHVNMECTGSVRGHARVTVRLAPSPGRFECGKDTGITIGTFAVTYTFRVFIETELNGADDSVYASWRLSMWTEIAQ